MKDLENRSLSYVTVGEDLKQEFEGELMKQ